jgi:uncharacterized OB-fold protein
MPQPDATTAFYWQAARDHRLEMQRCAACSRWHFPPVIACTVCQSQALVPTPLSGRGVIYSFTVVDRPLGGADEPRTPFVLALIDLPEQAGLRILTNILEIPPDQVRIGMPVEVVFEACEGGVLPQFRPC